MRKGILGHRWVQGCDYKCPYKREAEGDTSAEKEKNMCAEIRVIHLEDGGSS